MRGPLIAFLLTLAGALAPAAGAAQDTAPILTIDVLDVGQGDAILLRSAGRAALYDGGDGSVDVARLLRDLGIDSLDLVVASHHHADHIGGLIEVVRELRPRFLLENDVPHTTLTYERLLAAVRDAGSSLLEPTARRIGFGDAALHVLPPPGRSDWGQNDNSVGLVVEAGAFRFTLLGDSERRQQEWWLETMPHAFTRVQLHKASHHGSRNGDTAPMLARLAPAIVVIGVGRDNRYGHPHEDALALYAAAGARIYRTDTDRHIRVAVAADGSYTVTTRWAPAQRDAPRCIDLNSADAEELRRIVHVDAERAAQIVRLRARRPFASVEEITRVRGIGEARRRQILEQALACVQA